MTRHRPRTVPSAPLTRAGAMLEMVRQGLRDMEDTDRDRVLLGFCSVAVFGCSVPLAMKNLKSHGAAARTDFEEWFATPWQDELEGDHGAPTDPLLKFFTDIRHDIVHKVDISIGIVLASHGDTTRWHPGAKIRVGSVVVDGLPLPTMHRGEPITDMSMEHLSRLFVAYLEAMFESFVPVVAKVEQRIAATNPDALRDPRTSIPLD